MINSISNFQINNNYSQSFKKQASFGSAFPFAKAPDGKVIIDMLNPIPISEEYEKMVSLLTQAASGSLKYQGHNVVANLEGDVLNFQVKDEAKDIPEAILYFSENGSKLAFMDDMPVGDPIRNVYHILKKVLRIQELTR